LGRVCWSAAAYHHDHLNAYPADDIGEFATPESKLVRVRVRLNDDPITRTVPRSEQSSWSGRSDTDSVEVQVLAIESTDGRWISASGLATLTVEREPEATGHPPLAGLRAGDTVEFVGMLSRPRSPRNPGERDYAATLRDRRIRAVFHVADSSSGIVRLETGETSGVGVLAAVRRHAVMGLNDSLAPEEAPTARALLLGDASAMDRDEWDVFIRTGVVHALAISGQHLAVLAGFLWFALRLFGVRRSRGAAVVLIVIVAYTLLTGMRPSGVRAAVMVATVCGGIILRRPSASANSFALGWLVVIAFNPTDPFTLGCKLSFLSVFALVWGVARWTGSDPPDAMEKLEIANRSTVVHAIRWILRLLVQAYLVSLVIGVVNAPLLLAEQNVISPVGWLIGPPVVVLTSIALVAGFLVILLSPLGPVVVPFALVTEWSLALCRGLVRVADGLPGGALFLPGPPLWWLIGFYLGVAGVVLLDRVWQLRAAFVLACWVLVGILASGRSTPPDETRVTFLAVGYGGCTVLETPDGRVILYDAGTTTGPTAVRRVIAPYLWHRGIRRIDEVFLSHADTDHYNGVEELLRRFEVGQVTLTPTFAEKPIQEVADVLLALDRHGVPRRTASAGDKFTAGEVTFEVLHPPPNGPPGSENERSLVMLFTDGRYTLLLTGDLEKAGMSTVLDLEPKPVDVLMAPHHGSKAAMPRKLIAWSRPRFVVVNRGTGRSSPIGSADVGSEARIWDTATYGAITLRFHRTGLTAEAFQSGERQVIASGRP